MVLEQLKLAEPKTKEMVRILAALKVDSPALIVIDEPEENVIKSARNLAGIKTLPANVLNVIDILSYKMLLMPVAAVRKAEQIWGEKLSQRGDNATLRSIEPSINN